MTFTTPSNSFEWSFYRKGVSQNKLAEQWEKKLGKTSWTATESPDNAKQTNDSDSGVFVIAFTRALVKKIKEERINNLETYIELREKDFIFSISEERQKLKEAGFPKK
ncbi:protein of unknown function (Peptidase C48, SUMO/Sentrin domain) [endosymbiont DhMRE of Dentiscutata heterogama]|uniref:Ulp1 family isopeptidase n=1 Tax=endosymbiont DhMRE of Dentiscutata heterogama TaxID=1609546 RepID=UPI000629DBF8|nr:Ulp1 family isopeptidase [endosymbiont DhMRE of Dentiscutata heterogama]CFW93443.1 protein of unknown function (Peptidase C48, SUMO/Sentrin domain) [endosymbiont DhMRE of Dentiscutata heterogama]